MLVIVFVMLVVPLVAADRLGRADLWIVVAVADIVDRGFDIALDILVDCDEVFARVVLSVMIK